MVPPGVWISQCFQRLLTACSHIPWNAAVALETRLLPAPSGTACAEARTSAGAVLKENLRTPIQGADRKRLIMSLLGAYSRVFLATADNMWPYSPERRPCA